LALNIHIQDNLTCKTIFSNAAAGQMRIFPGKSLPYCCHSAKKNVLLQEQKVLQQHYLITLNGHIN
jgi:hypothetical protein